MLLLILLSALPIESVAREHCDLITVNAFYDDYGRLVFDQLLFYDWSDDAEHYQLRAWRMVKNPNQLPQLNQATGRYECRWMDGDVERVVTAGVRSESRTKFDPELTEREFLPKEKRRELRSAKTLRK